MASIVVVEQEKEEEDDDDDQPTNVVVLDGGGHQRDHHDTITTANTNTTHHHHQNKNTIQMISTESIQRIVSGQAIYDLASCIKELIDNSIDANSTTINSTYTYIKM